MTKTVGYKASPAISVRVSDIMDSLKADVRSEWTLAFVHHHHGAETFGKAKASAVVQSGSPPSCAVSLDPPAFGKKDHAAFLIRCLHTSAANLASCLSLFCLRKAETLPAGQTQDLMHRHSGQPPPPSHKIRYLARCCLDQL